MPSPALQAREEGSDDEPMIIPPRGECHIRMAIDDSLFQSILYEASSYVIVCPDTMSRLIVLSHSP